MAKERLEVSIGASTKELEKGLKSAFGQIRTQFESMTKLSKAKQKEIATTLQGVQNNLVKSANGNKEAMALIASSAQDAQRQIAEVGMTTGKTQTVLSGYIQAWRVYSEQMQRINAEYNKYNTQLRRAQKIMNDLNMEEQSALARKQQILAQPATDEEGMAKQRKELQGIETDISEIHKEMDKLTGVIDKQGSKFEQYRKEVDKAQKSLKGTLTTQKDVAQTIADSSKQLDKARAQWAKFGRNFTRVAYSMIASRIFAFLTRGLNSAYDALTEFNNVLEQAHVRFAPLLQDSEDLQGYLRGIEDFAARTPFTMAEAQNAVQKMLAAGFDSDGAMNALEQLTDAAAIIGALGDRSQFERIVLALTKIKTTGTLSAREVRQLARAGLDIYGILNEELGLTEEQLANIGSQGIDAETAITAILRGFERRYGGAAEAIQKTSEGLWSTIVDDFQISLNYILRDFFGFRRRMFKEIQDLVSGIADELQSGGLLREALANVVPESLRNELVGLTIAVENLGAVMRTFGTEMRVIGQFLYTYILQVLIFLIDTISATVVVFSSLTGKATEAGAALKAVATALAFLTITTIVSKLVAGLTVAIELLRNAALNARVIDALSATIVRLGIASNVTTAKVLALGLAVASLVGLGYLLVRRFQGVSDTLKDVGNIGAGALETVETDFGGVADAADDASEAMKGFLAGFDEVYTIPDDTGLSDTFDNLDDADPLPEIDFGSLSEDFDALSGAMDFQLSKWDLLIGGAIGFLNVLPFLRTGFSKIAPLFEGLSFKGLGKGLIGSVKKFPGLFQGAFKPLAGYITPIVDAFAGIGSGITGIASKFVIVTAAIGIITGLFMTLAAGIQHVRDNWDELAEFFISRWNQWIQPVIDSMREHFMDAVDMVAESFANWKQVAEDTITSIIGFFQDLFGASDETNEGLLSGFKETWEYIQENIGPVIEDIITIFLGLAKMSIEIFKDMWDTIVFIFRVAWLVIEPTVTSMVKIIVGLFTGMGAGLKVIFDGIARIAKGTFRVIAAFFKIFAALFEGDWEKFWQGIKDLFAGIWDLILGILETVGGAILSILGGLFGAIWALMSDSMRTWVTNLFNAGKSLGQSIVDGIKNSFWPAITGWVNDAISWIREKVGLAKKAANDEAVGAVGSPSTPSGPTYPTYSVSAPNTAYQKSSRNLNVAAFATGGIVDRQTLAWVGENNKREAVIPLTGNAMSPFAQAVAEELAMMQEETLPGRETEAMQPLYVGTLIADDKSLKELERRMRVVRLKEDERRGS